MMNCSWILNLNFIKMDVVLGIRIKVRRIWDTTSRLTRSSNLNFMFKVELSSISVEWAVGMNLDVEE